MGLLTDAVKSGTAASQGNVVGAITAFVPDVLPLFTGTPDTPEEIALTAKVKAGAAVAVAGQTQNSALAALIAEGRITPGSIGARQVAQDLMGVGSGTAPAVVVAKVNAQGGAQLRAGTAVKGSAVPSPTASAVKGTTPGPSAPPATPMAAVLQANQGDPAFVAYAPVVDPIPSMGLKGTPPSELVGWLNGVLPDQDPTMPPARSQVYVGPPPSVSYGVANPLPSVRPTTIPPTAAYTVEVGPTTIPRTQSNMLLIAASVAVLLLVVRHG